MVYYLILLWCLCTSFSVLDSIQVTDKWGFWFWSPCGVYVLNYLGFDWEGGEGGLCWHHKLCCCQGWSLFGSLGVFLIFQCGLERDITPSEVFFWCLYSAYLMVYVSMGFLWGFLKGYLHDDTSLWVLFLSGGIGLLCAWVTL